MKRILKVLPHATIVMAGMMIVFFLIDRVNTPMGFMTNEFHKWLSFLLALSCVGYSLLIIAYQRRRERREQSEAARRARAAQSRTAQRPASVRSAQTASKPSRTAAAVRPAQRPVQRNTPPASAGRTPPVR